MISGLNHITLAVSDLARSFEFYKTLGLKPLCMWPKGAYLLAGDQWVCLSLDAQRDSKPNPCYTHIAFSISQADLKALQTSDFNIWKKNTSEGPSLYILDPDGHKLELHHGSWQSRLASMKQQGRPDITFFP